MIWYLDLMWNARPSDTDARDLKIAEQASTIAELIRLNRQLTEVNSQLNERIERLEALLASQVDSKSSKTPVFTEN
jgi:fatty acid-binding protein DegV